LIKTARLQLEVLDLLPDNENTLFSDVADEQMSLLQVLRTAVFGALESCGALAIDTRISGAAVRICLERKTHGRAAVARKVQFCQSCPHIL
jgi:hypothetical protein